MPQATETQLATIREQREKQSKIQMELGSLFATQKDIEKRSEILMTELRSSGDSIKSIMEELSKEHGEGSLNLETGEFTPDSPKE
jgi:uncharacterized protein YoaH (UPF0181 family)